MRWTNRLRPEERELMATVTRGTTAEAVDRCEEHIRRLRGVLLDARTDAERETIHEDLNRALGVWRDLRGSSPPTV